MKRELKVNDEYYVSVVYNLLVADGLKVKIYELQHFLQWGTPEDLEDYQRWSTFFRNSTESSTNRRFFSKGSSQTSLIPMAGRGQRFVDEGYKEFKPLIPVSGKPMVVQSVN